jgi:hypothetical protein
MKAVILLAVGGVLAMGPVHAQNSAASFSSYYKGNRYDFNITQERLNRIPSWPATEANPPLSPRKAMAVAVAYLPKLVEDAGKWHQDEVTLTQVGHRDKWVYVVKFSGPLPPGVMDGMVPQMRLVVLMNGEIVVPVISKERVSQRPESRSRTRNARLSGTPRSR